MNPSHSIRLLLDEARFPGRSRRDDPWDDVRESAVRDIKDSLVGAYSTHFTVRTANGRFVYIDPLFQGKEKLSLHYKECVEAVGHLIKDTFPEFLPSRTTFEGLPCWMGKHDSVIVELILMKNVGGYILRIIA